VTIRVQGQPTEALTAAVPRVAHWCLAALPDSLTDSELKGFVNAFDRTCPTGRRDYAMARCLVDLGLRASEVASIQLDDLDWREGTLRIAKAHNTPAVACADGTCDCGLPAFRPPQDR
jgi:integrase/recombinase XerD